MGVRAPEEPPELLVAQPQGPGAASVFSFGILALVLLLANGRPIPAGSGAGADYAGKALASLAAAAAAAVMFAMMGRAHDPATARRSALVFALGTTTWAASQGLGPQPFGMLSLSLAVLFLLKAAHEPVWAGRAGLPLALAVAAWPANVAAAAVLGVSSVGRWPRSTLRLLAWAIPGIAVRFALQPFLSPRFTTGLEGLGETSGHLALLVSPGWGLLVFTPVVAVAVAGLVRAFAWGERWLTATLAAAFLAEWALVGASRSWRGPSDFGPVALTSALPLLFLFLPEGLEKAPRLGACLAAVSIAVQALGAFARDGSWERLYERPVASADPWSLATSPILYYARRRVLILALPEVRGGRWRTREYPFVVGGGSGSRFGFARGDVVLRGADSTAEDVYLLGGARLDGQEAVLEAPGDGLFLRVRPAARPRALELRIAGRGAGTIAVDEGSFWSPPRRKEYSLAGAFHLRHPYLFAESGGADLGVLLERGRATLTSVALVPPGDPESPLEVAPR